MVLTSIPKHKPTTHDKKRQGQHHKSSKHYAKTYWPYLPMLLVVCAGLVLNLSWSVGKSVLGYATNVSVSSLLQETNIQRSQNGQGALALNGQLSQAAQTKANDMAARDYWSHTTPEGTEPWQFISATGYAFTAAGENLAYGFDSSSATLAGWMNSAGHRANVLNTSYREVGFGIANSANYQGTGEETIIVAMYAAPQSVVAPSTVQNGRAPQKTTPQAAAAPEPQAEQPAEQAPATAEPAPMPDVQKAEDNQQTVASAGASSLPPARTVSRIDVLTSGNAQWAALALSAVASVSILVFVLRHARLWRKFLVRGEAFIIRHPVYDTLVLAVGVIGYVLTRTTGFIH